MIDKKTARPILKEGNAPTIGMVIGDTAARGKSGKREGRSCRRSAIESQELAHIRACSQLKCVHVAPICEARKECDEANIQYICKTHDAASLASRQPPHPCIPFYPNTRLRSPG